MKSKPIISLLVFTILFGFLPLVKAYSSETKISEGMVLENKETNFYRNMFEIGGGASLGYYFYKYDKPVKLFDDYQFLKNLDISILYNLNARYKIYFNKQKRTSVFLAPEFLYSFGSFEAVDSKTDTEELKFGITPKYGFKLSLGFEVGGGYSFSIGGGAQNGSYKYSMLYDGNETIESGHYWAPFVGIDSQYNIMKYIFIGFNLQYYFANIGLSEDGVLIKGTHEKIKNEDGSYFTFGLNLGVRF